MEKVFYGIDKIGDKIDYIINRLNLEKYSFELKLIMIESIANAFIHGNKSDKSKAIVVNVEVCKGYVDITVKDCGKKNKKKIFDEINEDYDNQLMLESGRGIYIIKSYTDEVRFGEGSIIMRKLIN